MGKYSTARRYGEGERPGRTLARMIHPQYSKAFITEISSPSGVTLHSAIAIRDTFLQCYSTLYTSGITSDLTAQEDYLAETTLTYLAKHMQNFLAKPFSTEEIATAIDAPKGASAPGLDGFTGDFYKAYKDLLAPILLEVYDEALQKQILPPTLREVVIILLPKLGKDPTVCNSDRLLSLLNLDYKMLAKMIASRMAQLMEFIISPVQSCFVPHRSTSLNSRTLRSFA